MELQLHPVEIRHAFHEWLFFLQHLVLRKLIVLLRLVEHLSLLLALLFSPAIRHNTSAMFIGQSHGFYLMALIDLLWTPLNYSQNHCLLYVCLWYKGFFTKFANDLRRRNEHEVNDLETSIQYQLSASNPDGPQSPFDFMAAFITNVSSISS